MLTLASATRVFVATQPTDMRRGFDGLFATVRDFLQEDPMSGHLFAFRNRVGDRLKILWWDQDGLAIYYKRLEVGLVPLFPPWRRAKTRIDRRRIELTHRHFLIFFARSENPPAAPRVAKPWTRRPPFPSTNIRFPTTSGRTNSRPNMIIFVVIPVIIPGRGVRIPALAAAGGFRRRDAQRLFSRVFAAFYGVSPFFLPASVPPGGLPGPRVALRLVQQIQTIPGTARRTPWSPVGGLCRGSHARLSGRRRRTRVGRRSGVSALGAGFLSGWTMSDDGGLDELEELFFGGGQLPLEPGDFGFEPDVLGLEQGKVGLELPEGRQESGKIQRFDNRCRAHSEKCIGSPTGAQGQKTTGRDQPDPLSMITFGREGVRLPSKA